MPQPDAPKFTGKWKALFICPNQKIIRDLAPLLRKHLPTFSGHDLNAYPMRHQLAEVVQFGDPQSLPAGDRRAGRRGIGHYPDLLRIDAKLPIIVVLAEQ